MANIMFEPPEQPLVQPPGVWERGLGGPLFAIGAVIGIGIFLCKRRGKGDPYIIKRSGR